MVLLVLVTPVALLGAMFAMDVVERWVAQEQGQVAVTFDPLLMGNRDAVGQSP